jgi:hypothetical protein
MPKLTVVLVCLVAWCSSAEAQTCKRYIPGCKMPEFIEDSWSNSKPRWVEEVPGICAT